VRSALDPSSVHYASDLLQHDVGFIASQVHHSFMHLADAGAAAADVVDISKVTSGVSGTGLTKPMDLPSLPSLPSLSLPKLPSVQLPDFWGMWMGLFRTTIIKLHDVTGNYGWSITAIVLMIKALTYPLNYKVYAAQFEMQAIQPEIDKIKEQYKDNPDLINMRTSVLFAEKEVNPLAGCLPILIQFPIFIALYRTLLNLGKDRMLGEPFLFLPSLEGPVVAGLPTDYVGVREDAPWLLQNWQNGAPPLGWHDTIIYCALPILIVVAQLVSTSITKAGQPAKKPSEQKGDGSAETLVAILPYLIGWFALNLPAGCSLYWFLNTVLTTAIQVYIKNQFKPQLEAAAAHVDFGIQTEAEKKMQEQINEEGWIRGVKAVYKKFDDFLGMGLPEVSEKPEKKMEEEDKVSIFDAKFWIKDDTEEGKLKPEEIDEVRAKFLAARAARQAKKAAQAKASEGLAASGSKSESE